MSGDTDEIINAGTGELIAYLTPEDARKLTDSLRTTLGVAWELVVRAFTERAWAALGYPSWDAYCAAEFPYHLQLPKEERQQVIASLREAGLSGRAIAAATGVSEATVRNDLNAGAQYCAPQDRQPVEPNASSAAPGGEQGTDPEALPAASGSGPTTTTGDEALDVIQRLKAAADAEAAKITGRDGKQYPAAQAKVAKIRELAALGMDPGQIAEAMGVSRDYVSNTAARNGVEIVAGTSRAAVAARVAKAKQLASEGHSSRQIAEAIGIAADSFGAFRKRHDIDVPADLIVGKTHNLDHDRIVSEAVSSLEGIAMGVGLIGDPADAGLDAEQIQGWVTSLHGSLTVLIQFRKQLKEMTQ